MTQEEFHKRYTYNPNTDCLGEGGFGKVYKAYDTHLDHYVAIKMAEVKPHLEEVRLRKEVEVISKLPTHPNIAHYDVCYTFSTFAGEYDFGVLQYYEQGNLQQLLTDKQLTYYQKDSMLKQILEGIVFLHSHGIIHRDLKPQNILIALNKNGVYVPKITDFGISKKLDVNKSSVFTNSLAGAGTLSFASPEQLLGNTIRKNTDLWSFGVIACWMFTGKLPFNSGALAVTSEAGRIELFKQITAGDAAAIIAQIPADWRNVVKQCLVVDVDNRVSGAGKCLEMVGGKVSAEKTKKATLQKNIISSSKTILDNQKTVVVETKVANEESVTDIHGNVYKTVRIGNQVWMAEDLKVWKYRNGDKIESWLSSARVSSAPSDFAKSESNDSKYGFLYNWKAVNDKRSIAPIGWHVPSDDDWSVLENYLDSKTGFDWQGPNGEDWSENYNVFEKFLGTNTGGHLKETGTLNWKNQNIGATNESGFSALPSGFVEGEMFSDMGELGFWWSSTSDSSSNSWSRFLQNSEHALYRDSISVYTLISVRCIKNN